MSSDALYELAAKVWSIWVDLYGLTTEQDEALLKAVKAVHTEMCAAAAAAA